ncbi:hypothetical protein K402DRAFT_231013 [Aulographum hederae CBS 113979]|uniref:Protein kinase domain-containing protein n=1 Tax=Aulographum hederae CBS 113979 TaxID=1176131 RepID=A0A6G1HBX5_9PEZI|nr:hypothetical protein K402DRAFT_231013 [Aulographum hederae CBS 113979]
MLSLTFPFLHSADSFSVAPECSNQKGGSNDLQIKDNLQADVWSLGCVLSEAATWFGRGLPGLQEYREGRLEETYQSGVSDPGCFHDGNSVLDFVKITHESLIATLSTQDRISENILDMIDDMLAPLHQRLDASQLWRKSSRLLERHKPTQGAAEEWSIRHDSAQSPFPPLPPLPPLPSVPARSPNRSVAPASNLPEPLFAQRSRGNSSARLTPPIQDSSMGRDRVLDQNSPGLAPPDLRDHPAFRLNPTSVTHPAMRNSVAFEQRPISPASDHRFRPSLDIPRSHYDESRRSSTTAGVHNPIPSPTEAYRPQWSRSVTGAPHRHQEPPRAPIRHFSEGARNHRAVPPIAENMVPVTYIEDQPTFPENEIHQFPGLDLVPDHTIRRPDGSLAIRTQLSVRSNRSGTSGYSASGDSSGYSDLHRDPITPRSTVSSATSVASIEPPSLSVAKALSWRKEQKNRTMRNQKELDLPERESLKNRDFVSHLYPLSPPSHAPLTTIRRSSS